MNQIANKWFNMSDIERHACYSRVFETTEGQLVLEDLKQRCFHYFPCFGGDVYQTYGNEGMRAVLLHILTMLEPVKAKE